ncbi:hypothetical protein FD14_GL001295 [Secundilactobacillus similis DSM 23365 = JCM 2765]|uniref:Gram-positive cocci surface proteins LPxTG domain-containing protein n=1 Tax=Secundilactobacillus similis DSM 23365 = JCM 2765 TaxID=1423804 RepID=A0A0R2F8T2_9LACO|nr:hypothetical protein FD14_GL001295 [Secundilactobacillus similis DSM 23365 = JCM 2765]
MQALASNTKRIEIQSARLIDKDNTAPATVKAGSEHELVVNLTINNKDGDHESGTTQLWVPEQQLTLLEKKATFEPETAADNARLVYEKLSNNQLQLSWQNVTNTATFKVELPVRVNHAMTEMQLPIAVGSATDYLQPLTVLNEDATDDAVAEITGDPGLPGNILANLDQYLTAQQAQEEAEAAAAKQEADAAAQKEAEEQAKADAAAKAEAEAAEKKAAEKKAAEDKAKQEAEAKEQAEKAAAAKKEKEQQEADEAKETAKTRMTMKTRSAEATEESKNGEERESKDSKLDTTGKNIAEFLKNDNGPANSFFNRVQLTDTDTKETINVEDGDKINVSDKANFTLHYEWDTGTIRKLIAGKHKLAVNDYYTFKITGLKIENEVTSKDILDKNSGDTLGQYSLKKTGENEYTVTVKLTSDKIEITTVNYVMDIEQVTIPGDDIEFEYNDGAIWTATPVEEKSLLAKSGQFVGSKEIRWTIGMDTSEAKVGKKIQFSDITLTDELKTNNHDLNEDNLRFTAEYETDGKDVSDYFKPEVAGNRLTIKGTKDVAVEDNLVFTFVTTYKGSSNTEFKNGVKGKIGDNLNIKEVTATIQANSVGKSYKGYDDKDKTYAWQIETTLSLSQYPSTQVEELLKGLVIKDETQGAHKFSESKLDLEMKIGNTAVDYLDWFEVDITDQGKFMTLKVHDKADIKDLRDKLIVNGADQKIVLTYKTEKDGAGNIANVKNSVSLEFDGESHSGNAGGSDKYITKSGELDYKYDEKNATINWTITVNPKKYAFNTLEVVDVLPERTIADVEAVVITEDADGNKSEAPYTPVKGYVEEYPVIGDNFYEFKTGENDAKRGAIQFNFDSSYSEKEITIKLTTQHAWDDLGENYTYKNEAGARFDDNWFGFADGSVTIQKEIGDNVYKDGDIQLDKSDVSPENANNQVEWTVGFGSRLRTTFGHGANQTNEVQIRDWLNANDSSYLSFPEDEDAYQLYEMKHTRNGDKYTFSKDKLIDKREYNLVIKNDPESKTGKIITIQFTDEAKVEGYRHLSLVFATPIDLMAWRPSDDQKELPSKYDFHNNAVVTYGGKAYGEVEATVGFSSDNVYGKKTIEKAEGSQITWNVLLNALGKDLGRPTITDKVSAGHVHSANLDDIEVSLVDVDYTSDGTNGFDFEVNKDNQEILERNKDYTVDMTDDVMTINLKIQVNRPLQLRYKTVVKDYQLGSYKNEVSLSGKGYSPTFSKTATVTASAWADSFLAAFTKIDGETDKPLAGAKFKLQWDRDGTGVWTDAKNIDGKAYDVVTSNELGQIQFELLGDFPTYRLIEVATPAGYESSQMAPLEFDKDSYDALKGHRPVIKNWDVKKADLVISKSVKNLDKQKFEFEIQAVTGTGDARKVDTDFNGTYKLDNGNEVTFENGVSTKIGIASDKEVTLKNLPVYKATQDGKGDKWQFIVREVSESDEYNTLVWLNNEKPLAGKETAPFKLDENQANSVMVFFKNTADTGNLRLNKLVISDDSANEKKDFEFTITATEGKDSVAGETFKATGRYEEVEFNDKGIATVNLRHNENVEILGLPAATKFKVEEAHHPNLTADWSIDNGDYEESAIPEVTIAADKTTLVTYRNSDVLTGRIRLEKLILGDVKADQNFTFTVKADPQITAGQYTISVFKVGDNQPLKEATGNFEDGEIKVTLRGNQYAMIGGLPLTSKYTVSETNPNTDGVKGIETTWETSDADGKDLIADEITLENKNTVEPVIFTNALPNGDLKLNKKVLSSYPVDSEREFDFTIEAETNSDIERLKDKVYQVENHDLTYLTFNADGQAKLTLRHNQSALIKGLPVGVQVRITEKSDANFSTTYQVGDGDKEDQDGDGPTVTISDEKTEVVKYENTRHPDGKLYIEKIGENLNTKQDFDFKIKALDNDELTGIYDGELRQSGKNEATDYGVEFENGEANIKLKAGEYLIIPGLPLGNYVVSEKATDGLSTSWTVTGQEGSNSDETDAVGGYYEAAPAEVTAKTTPKVVYTNSLITGKLHIEKIGKNLTTNQSFKFKIEAKDNDQLTNTYDGVIKQRDDTEATDHEVEFENGEANIELKAGEYLVISGLPLGDYVVSEKVTDGLSTSWTVTGQEGSNSDETDAVGGYYEAAPAEVTAKTTPKVVYTNSLITGKLHIEKIGKNLTTNQSFEFKIEAKDDNQLTKTYDGVIKQRDDTEATDHEVEFENGEANIKLKAGEYLIISGLPLGNYVVSEKAIDGLATSWTVTGQEDANSDEIPAIDGYYQAEPAKVTAKTTPKVVYTNSLITGKLQVNKHVASQLDKDLNATYTFDLEVNESDANRVNGNTYKVTGNDKQPDLTFEDGKAVLQIQGGGSAIVNGLPTSITVSVKERVEEDGDLAASWLVGAGGKYEDLTTDNYPEVEIQADKDRVVSYKNTRDPDGQLQIEKQVTGAVADEDASYDFIIEAIDTATTDGTEPDDGDTTEQPTETEDGDGDTTEQPVGDETSTDTQPTPETPTPDATNLLDLNGNYSVLIYQRGTDKLLHKDTVEFDKGQATLALKANQYAVVNGLPLHTYQVREVDPEVANMSTSWSLNGGKLTAGLQADAHELTADGVMTVLFNNAVQTGDLSIEKQVTGAVTEADEQQAYDFTVTAYREAADGAVEVDTDYNQQHAATLTAANGAATTIRLDLTKGELAVSLKAGERLTIHNLDENRVVTVTETPLADFITTHRIGTEAVTAGNETRQITIGDDVTKHVTFINDKPATPEVAWLSLTKSVLGSAGETDRGFDFTVQLVDHLQQPITGIVKVVKTTATGTYVSGEMLFDDHGTATVTLQHNETVKLEVPNGAHYQIAETDYSADGYVTTTSQGGNPERTGLTVTGIAHQVDPSTALVVYYNRADTTDPDDELAHTDTEDDQAMPELVGPATDDGSGTTGMTGANPQAHTGTGGTGTSGSVAPQAYTSGSSKGILPQTGEFLRNHWVAVLGWLLLMVLIGMMVWRYRLTKKS